MYSVVYMYMYVYTRIHIIFIEVLISIYMCIYIYVTTSGNGVEGKSHQPTHAFCSDEFLRLAGDGCCYTPVTRSALPMPALVASAVHTSSPRRGCHAFLAQVTFWLCFVKFIVRCVAIPPAYRLPHRSG